MGRRLFLRIFGIFALVILCASFVAATGLWLLSQSVEKNRLEQQQHFQANILQSTVNAFNLRGESGAREQINAWQGMPFMDDFYVIRGDDHTDINNKPVDIMLFQAASRAAHTDPEPAYAALSTDRLGEEYIFYFDNWGVVPPEFRRNIVIIPGLEMNPLSQLASILAFFGLCCGIMSFIVARNIATPIRVLQSGFQALTAGQLDTRIRNLMPQHRDELGELANDFDNMAQNMQRLIGKERHLLHHVSHEMRSPLARMQAILGLAQQQPLHSAKYLERLATELTRMDTLVDELLTLSRLENTTQPIEKEVLAFAPFITQLVADSHEVAIQKHQHISLTLTDSEPMVVANEAYLYRAFDNIIRNALRYSPAGSQIHVLVRTEANQLVTAIQDNGPGVDPREISNIFTSFFRGKSSIGTSGTGLGLALAKNIMEQHGGSVFAANLDPKGFEVTLTLPLANPEIQSVKKPAKSLRLRSTNSAEV